jgi:hypothetical protein
MALRFPARGRTRSAHFGEHCRRGISGHDGNRDDAAARRFHFFSANDLIAGPIASLDQDIGKENRNNLARREFIKNYHGVNACESGENFRAFEFGENGAPGPLQFAHTRVTVDSDDKRVSEGTRMLQALNMPWVQKIKAPIRENNDAPVALLAAESQNRFL